MDELTACSNTLCKRKVPEMVAYCCTGCRLADERHYEVHEDGPLGHSQYCNERLQERGEFTREEELLQRFRSGRR